MTMAFFCDGSWEVLVRMRHEDVHFEKKKFLTNSGRKKSAPSQRDPPAKIVLAKFLHQNDSKRLYVVSLHCWRCTISIVAHSVYTLGDFKFLHTLSIPYMLWLDNVHSTLTLPTYRKPTECVHISHVILKKTKRRQAGNNFDWERIMIWLAPRRKNNTSVQRLRISIAVLNSL